MAPDAIGSHQQAPDGTRRHRKPSITSYGVREEHEAVGEREGGQAHHEGELDG